MCFVLSRVGMVLLNRAVGKIRNFVVVAIPVKMANDEAIRSRPNKNLSDQFVDVNAFL